MCSNILPNIDVTCKDIRNQYLICQVKPYVYEVIDGKRKRVSPFVMENGVIIEIKQRAIIKRLQ